MTDMKEFRDELICAGQGLEDTHRHDYFVDRVVTLLENGDVVGGLMPCIWRGKGTANRQLAIDAASSLQPDGSVTLLVAAFKGDDTPGTLSKGETDKHLKMVLEFAEESLAGGLQKGMTDDHPAAEVRNFLRDNAANVLKVKLVLITDQSLSSHVKELPQGNVANIPCEFHVWDIDRLHELSSRGHESIEIDLQEEFAQTIPCLSAHLPVAEYVSYLCVVPAALLADLYARHGARLLEANVRGFLSERGKVNRGIRSTIQNHPHMFFAYNNGLTATASSVELSEDEGHILKIRDLQIVNGGQTTASLFWARKKHRALLDRVSVQMKLSVIPESMADSFDDIVSRISQYANSQNKVSDADLFANHPFHREMEKISKRAGVSPVGGGTFQTYWFYERARAQYDNERNSLSKAEQQRFDKRFPKKQLLTKTELAKQWACWKQLPQFVSRGAQKNFQKFAESIARAWEDKPGQFNELFYKRIVAVGIIYKALEARIQKEAWYDGYRINIIAYTLAVLFRTVEKEGARLNLLGIWAAQDIDPPVVEELVELSRTVYDHLKNSPARSAKAQWGNLGQWFKEDRCWDEAASLQVALPSSIRSLLISAGQYNEQDAAATQANRVDRGIDAQIEVVRLHTEGYWQRLKEWNMEDPVLSEVEHEAVVRMARTPIAARPPSERESIVLMEAKRRAETNEFA